MKGGITSGVAYPAAVQELSQRYDFASIGGASAGAIAAAVTAAAQYAAPSGFDRLRELRTEMTKPNLLPGLFQTTRPTRPLMHLLLAIQHQRTSWAKAAVVVWQVVGRLALPTALWTSAGFAALAIVLGHAGAAWSSLRWPAVTVLALLLFGTWLVALLGCVVFRLYRAVFVHLPTSDFGMCLGKSEDGSGRPALTEWLHRWIQYVAGLPESEPLTFSGLADRGLDLRMMTTDLTWARPARFPQRQPTYHYSPEDFEPLFPDAVLRHLEEHSGPARVVETPHGPRTLRTLPCQDLPVLVATRMSLALPVLLSAIPLWIVPDTPAAPATAAPGPASAPGVSAPSPPAAPERHWISDGGLSSNFPMQLFDTWVPNRPTFGLNLMPGGTDGRLEDEVRVYADTPPAPRSFAITSVTGLLGQALGTMQNWHDLMLAELDGFHDRIAYIDLSSNEGGMNIAMPKPVIEHVEAKGARAGRLLRDTFNWQRHQMSRYRTFMGMLQEGLVPPPPPATSDGGTVRAAWEAGLERLLAEGGTEATPGATSNATPGPMPPEWYRAAAEATRNLMDAADAWLGTVGDPGTPMSFRPDPPLSPPARMRITPDV